MYGLSGDVVLEVEDLHVGDHPLAVIEHFQHVFHAQIAEVEADPISRMELIELQHEFMRRESEKRRYIRHGDTMRHHVPGLTRCGIMSPPILQGWIVDRPEVLFDDGFRIELPHSGGQGLHPFAFFTGRLDVAVPEFGDADFHQRQEVGMDKLRQMEDRRLAAADKGEEIGRLEPREFNAEGFSDGRAVFSVEFIQHRDDMALLVFGYLAPFVHEGANGRFRQEREKIPGVRESARHPDKSDIPAPELSAHGNPDADGDSHDLAGVEELGCGLRRHEIIVDHRQAADPFDPGIHDQVGGGFASFRVGVVDMVVEGDLVPLFRHLQEMVTPQFLADQARFPRGGHTKIMGQFELPFIIPPHPDQLLHDLEEHPCRIPAQ